MNSTFPNRWSFSYLKFTKYVTNIIVEPKYKFGQQEQVTVRNHNRSTSKEPQVTVRNHNTLQVLNVHHRQKLVHNRKQVRKTNRMCHQINRRQDKQAHKKIPATFAYTGWMGWAMVLGSFQCRGVLLHLHIVGQGPAVLAASAGRVGYFFFNLIFNLSSISNVLSFGRRLE